MPKGQLPERLLRAEAYSEIVGQFIGQRGWFVIGEPVFGEIRGSAKQKLQPLFPRLHCAEEPLVDSPVDYGVEDIEGCFRILLTKSCTIGHEIEPKMNKLVPDVPVFGFKAVFSCIGGCNGKFHIVCGSVRIKGT